MMLMMDGDRVPMYRKGNQEMRPPPLEMPRCKLPSRRPQFNMTKKIYSNKRFLVAYADNS
jgi:hypothetical protein